MNAYAWIQDLVLALILVAAIYYAWRKVLPGPSGRVLARASMALLRPGRPAWQQRLGRWLQPRTAAAGCDSGCSACDGCAPKPVAAQPEAAPLTFHRDPRRPGGP